MRDNVKVLYSIKPKAEWRKDILEKLDQRPLTFDDLASEFGFEKDTRQYLDLLLITSGLQETLKDGHRIIKTAFVEGTNIYPLYRADQEKELIRRCFLSQEETNIDLSNTVHEFGISPRRALSILKAKER